MDFLTFPGILIVFWISGIFRIVRKIKSATNFSKTDCTEPKMYKIRNTGPNTSFYSSNHIWLWSNISTVTTLNWKMKIKKELCKVLGFHMFPRNMGLWGWGCRWWRWWWQFKIREALEKIQNKPKKSRKSKIWKSGKF